MSLGLDGQLYVEHSNVLVRIGGQCYWRPKLMVSCRTKKKGITTHFIQMELFLERENSYLFVNNFEAYTNYLEICLFAILATVVHINVGHVLHQQNVLFQTLQIVLELRLAHRLRYGVNQNR